MLQSVKLTASLIETVLKNIILNPYRTIQSFKNHQEKKKKHFENTEEKGENAGKQHFLLFPQ